MASSLNLWFYWKRIFTEAKISSTLKFPLDLYLVFILEGDDHNQQLQTGHLYLPILRIPKILLRDSLLEDYYSNWNWPGWQGYMLILTIREGPWIENFSTFNHWTIPFLVTQVSVYLRCHTTLNATQFALKLWYSDVTTNTRLHQNFLNLLS